MSAIVTKLMELADEYANFAYLGDPDSRYNARQELQDELERLFTRQDPTVVDLAIDLTEHGTHGDLL